MLEKAPPFLRSRAAPHVIRFEDKLKETTERWGGAVLEFTMWKTRAVPVLIGFGQTIEDLEEAQLHL